MNLTRRRLGALALGSATACAVTARAHADTETAAAVDGFVKRCEIFGFSGQVLAARAGTILSHRAYGWADRKRNRRMAMDTPIGIASMSKQYTAAAVMKLAEAGRLALDEPIGRHLKDAPPDKAALTLHQLLTHTGGMPPGDLSADFELTSRQAVIAKAYAAPLRPAGAWRYSNAGYNLVAAVIEKASGRTYEDFLREALFRPAGLTATGFAEDTLVRRQAARAYNGWVDNGGPADWPRPNFRPWGGGTVFSTALDTYRWQQALATGRVLSAASLAALTAPHVRPEPDAPYAYSYGGFVEPAEHGVFIERSGDWEQGYNAAWHAWPQDSLTLIILSNATTGAGQSMRQAVQGDVEKILRGAAPDMPPVAPPTSAASRRARQGDYGTGNQVDLRLVDDGAYLWAGAESQKGIELLGGYNAAVRAGLAKAAERTERLLSGLQQGGQGAYAEALMDRGDLVADYWGEWSELIATHGPLRSWRVVGAVKAGRGAQATTRLDFERKSMSMSFFWSDGGNGRLQGSSADIPTRPPLAYIVSDSGVGYDPVSGLTSRALFAAEGAAMTMTFSTDAGAVSLTKA